MEIKADGYSVEFDRGIVGIPALGGDAVTVTEVLAHTSDIISGVI